MKIYSNLIRKSILFFFQKDVALLPKSLETSGIDKQRLQRDLPAGYSVTKDALSKLSVCLYRQMPNMERAKGMAS